MKDNHYADEKYQITQLNSQLQPEWTFLSTNTLSRSRGENGEITCADDHPNGFEWCINAPVVDANGTVYANNEDGALYAIHQGGQSAERIFLRLALGAAYTPLSLGPDGKIYTQNDGILFVVGAAAAPP